MCMCLSERVGDVEWGATGAFPRFLACHHPNDQYRVSNVIVGSEVGPALCDAVHVHHVPVIILAIAGTQQHQVQPCNADLILVVR